MPATDWDSLLQHLAAAPRENGSPAIETTAHYLSETLRGLGWQVELAPFTAYPYEQRALGILLLLGSALYWWSMRSRRFGLAALLALALPILTWGHFDHHLPVSFGIGAMTQNNVVARLPVPEPAQRLLFSAHYDTKTDLGDHIVRSPVQILAMPMILVMVVLSIGSFVRFQAGNFSDRRRRAVTVVAWLALLYGTASFGVFTGGMFVRARSPGAIDDGAACAVLVRLAEALAQAPPARTEVELVFFSAEELSAQGSSHFVTQRYGDGQAPHPMVINLDPFGASTELAVVGRENTFLKNYEPSAQVVSLLDRVHRHLKQLPLPITPMGGLTDGFSFLDHGIPAATLLNAVPPFILPRKLHSHADTLDRIAPGALDSNLRFLVEVVRAVDGRPGDIPPADSNSQL
jgi:hypothetical protein